MKNINGLFYGRQTPNRYEIGKEKIRENAKMYQILSSENAMSYSDIIDSGEYFMRVGKRYGLLKEFKENGVI